MEYDAYRGDLEAIEALPSTQVSSIKLEEAQRKHTGHKAVYDQLREDVSVKLRFLNENKVCILFNYLSQFTLGSHLIKKYTFFTFLCTFFYEND